MGHEVYQPGINTIDRKQEHSAQSQGYEFVTISELRLSGDTIIDVNGVQKAA